MSTDDDSAETPSEPDTNEEGAAAPSSSGADVPDRSTRPANDEDGNWDPYTPPSPADAPPDSTPLTTPASSDTADTPAPDPGDCAEIPTYSHAILTAQITLVLQLPYSTDQAQQLPHKFLLTNADASYSKTLVLASDGQPGPADGTTALLFEDIVEDDTYTLNCDDGGWTYAVFSGIPYDELASKLGGVGGADPTGSSPTTDSSNTDSSSAGSDQPAASQAG
jgi:hypothetical protein